MNIPEMSEQEIIAQLQECIKDLGEVHNLMDECNAMMKDIIQQLNNSQVNQ